MPIYLEPAQASIFFLNDPQVRAASYMIAALAIGILGKVYGTFRMFAWIGAPSTAILALDIVSHVRAIRKEGLQDQRILNLAYRIFIHGIIWGVFLSGLCLTHTIQGTVALVYGVSCSQPFHLLEALNYFTGIVAIWGPFSQSILNASDHYFFPRENEHLKRSIEEGIKAILQVGEGFKNFLLFSLDPIWVRMAVDTNFLYLLSVEMRQERLVKMIRTLSDAEINTLILRYPYILNIDFLERNLTADKFEEIVRPHLSLSISEDDLIKIDRQIVVIENIPNFSEHQRTHYSRYVSQYENVVAAIKGWQLRLPAHSDRAPDFILEINTRSNSLERWGIPRRIQNLRTRLALPSADLAALLREQLGFTEADFKTLRPLFPEGTVEVPEDILGASVEDRQFNALLAQRGLRTEDDLRFFKIWQPQTSRVRHQLRCHLNQPPLPENISVRNPSRFNLSGLSILLKSMAARIAVVANYIFYYGVIVSMLGIQYGYSPIATTVGLCYGLYRTERYYSLQKLSAWETVPDFTGQTITDRCRFIWQRTYATLWAIRFGSLSALFTGIYLADTLRHYGGPPMTRLNTYVTSFWRSQSPSDVH